MRSTILLASFLLIIPLISANPTRPQAARQSTPTGPTVVPYIDTAGPTYDFTGCYNDSSDSRVLKNYVTPIGLFTVENCINTCSITKDEQGIPYPMGGVENGVSCFCDNQISFIDVNGVDPSHCETPCAGVLSEACGGYNLILIYQISNR